MKSFTKSRLSHLLIAGLTGGLCYGLTGCGLRSVSDITVNENITRPENQNNGVKVFDKSVKSLDEREIDNLLRLWENAQDAGDFEGYQSCYAKPFKGVKTTPKGSKEYNYAEWMADRRRMIKQAVGLDIEIKNRQVSIDGETATVEFDQYYRSKSFSDWGPKILKIKRTPGGAKIVYEMLKASYPL